MKAIITLSAHKRFDFLLAMIVLLSVFCEVTVGFFFSFSSCFSRFSESFALKRIFLFPMACGFQISAFQEGTILKFCLYQCNRNIYFFFLTYLYFTYLVITAVIYFFVLICKQCDPSNYHI